jgi:hypothetical protein
MTHGPQNLKILYHIVSTDKNRFIDTPYPQIVLDKRLSHYFLRYSHRTVIKIHLTGPTQLPHTNVYTLLHISAPDRTIFREPNQYLS